MKRNYRWGILGAGRIAEKFCTAIAFVEGSEVYAVASRDISKAKDYAARFNASRSYDNYQELVTDKEVDIIYIATPHSFHYEQALVCLQHQKAVLCEKPMTLSHVQTAELVAAARENRVFLMEGLWTACMPFMDKVRSIIANGRIGQLQYLAADFGFEAPPDPEGRLYKKSLAGGSVLDIGVYPVSLATILLGEPSLVRSVSKLAGTGVDEYANVIMQYSNGATAHVLSSIIFNTPIEATIIGTKGRISIRSPWFKATELSFLPHEGAAEDFSIPHDCNGFEHEVREVMHCLDQGLLESPKVSHELSLAISRTMDQVLLQAGVLYDEPS
jgi:predicted dehydrogenase